MDHIDEIYYTLQGQLVPEAAVPWVANVFLPGSDCDEAYTRMWDAYQRLLERLDESGEDPDVEIIRDSLSDIQYILCRSMFLCGMEFARRTDGK